MIYKFRAESATDADRFMDALENAGRIEQPNDKLPDVVVTFSDSRHLVELIDVANGLPDGHVIADTIAPEGKYDSVCGGAS